MDFFSIDYVIILVGVVIAFAFGRFLGPVKQIANQLPGSDAKTAS